MQTDVFSESSRSQKRFISFLYRGVLIIFSIILVSLNDIELFIKDFEVFTWIFILYSIVYFVLFLFLFLRRTKPLPFLRLLNDYLYIGLTVYFIGIIDVYTLSLLFIPILNSQNHSGDRKTIALYLFPIIIICLINRKIEYLLLLPFIMFYIVNSFEKLKNKYQLFYNELNSSLDDFLIKEDSINKLHNIYEIIIPIFNKHSFFSKPIKDIYCFQKQEDSLSIANGSSFVFEFNLIEDKEVLGGNKNIVYDKKMILNEEKINQNVFLKIKRNDIDYVFLIIPEEEGSGLKMDERFFFYRLLFPFFYRLAHIYNFKKIQSRESKKNFNTIAKKVTYVNNAINSMHFTRNKLGPLKNYLAMRQDYDSSSEETRRMIEPYLLEEIKKARTSLTLILGRADMILEKSNNPFNVLDCSDMSFLNVLEKVREASFSYFEANKFIFNFGKFDYDVSDKVSVNEVGIELVLSNWLSNVLKHKSSDIYGVEVSSDVDNYYLNFYNEFNRKSDKKIPDFVNDFNSNERMAILKRNTHGLVEIKDFLEQMNIDSVMIAENNKLSFMISFKKVKK